MTYSLGDEMGDIARVWLVLELTGSPSALGGTVFTLGVARAIGNLAFGPVIDRFDRRRAVAVGSLMQAFAVGGLPLLHVYGLLEPWHIYLLTAAEAIISPLVSLGMQALVPSYVSSQELEAANALLSLTGQTSVLSGPALGGFLIAILSAPWVLAVNGLCFLVTALGFLFVATEPIATPVTGHDTKITEANRYWDGVRYLVRHGGLASLAVLTFGFNFAYGPVQVGLPVFTQEVLRVGASGLGVLWTLFAVGWMVGGMATGTVNWTGKTSATLALVPVAWGITTMLLAGTQGFVVAGVIMFAGGLSFSPYGILSLTARQRVTPAYLRGRVFAATGLFGSLGTPLGAALGGWLISIIGLGPVFVGSGLLSALVGISILLSGRLRVFDGIRSQDPPSAAQDTHPPQSH